MSLRFYFGPSGAGKSRRLYEEIIRRAKEQPAQNFWLIVPEQFTMQTEKDIIALQEQGGIMNIDVLSFGRLSHRILQEVGGREIAVLDDTGKSLVLQKVAADLKEELPVLGSFLHRQGYIHEVKSAISEFMQYGIGTEEVDRLISFSEKKGALVSKLKDLKTLYNGFQDYIRNRFITTEEKLDVLRASLHKSELIKECVVALDGFTGFTPVQNRLLQELMCLCRETIVTVTIGEGESPYEQDGEQKLFHLSKKTVAVLDGLARKSGVERGPDVFITPDTCSGGTRFLNAPALQHLERNLFRYPYAGYEGEQQEIRLFETTTPKEEVHQTGLYIQELIRTKKLAYRDIAVIMGDLEGYAPYVEEEFAQMGIPCFLDRTRGIRLNPMTEYIKSALELYLKDFSYEAVFHYLKSGLADISLEDVDSLENYVLQTGIRGYHKWSRLFTHKTAWMKEEEEPLMRLNQTRERLMEQVEILHMEKRALTKSYVNHLCDFLEQNKVQQKLARYEAEFQQSGQPSRAREYAQIYRLVMELLNQIYELLGEESISLQEFADILEAGFGEIQVGTLPQNVDRVVVGDMERTRLKQIKVLFFLGINEGNIPKSTTKGGIISDMDREFLRESGMELAPSPRQQMFIQRLYLYLNLTKPSGHLFLGYSKINSQGKSIRPSYLIDVVKKLFPLLKEEHPQERSAIEQMVNPIEGMSYLAEKLRAYAEGSLDGDGQTELFTIYQAYGSEALWEERKKLTCAAFRRYQASELSRAVAGALYGKNLENSVTRLETYAACAYRHFLQYGLSLKEREEFGFEAVDMGNIYHEVLERFAGSLAEKQYTWFDFPEEFARTAVNEALQVCAAAYGDTILYSSARNEYAITRMGRILTRTVLTLQKQLKRGEFCPDKYEFSFHLAQQLDSIQVTLSPQEKMRLQGRIDRIDIAESDDKVYVKVIDYKSGSRQFDLAAVYYGLQLQLVVYMNAAMELEAGEHPGKEAVPAAMLYYHVDDPAIETPVELSDEEINEQILGRLRMNGVVNSEPGIVERLDRYMQEKSDVIPVEKKKDGSFSARSSVMSGDELKVVSGYVSRRLQTIGREILEGQIALNPYTRGSEDACTYCAYKRVCGFDESIPGYEKRSLEETDKAELMEKMKKDE